ncbi:MAG TPA: HAMP domain-containing sensor histidine kinase [Gemmatimonadales bacterium]
MTRSAPPARSVALEALAAAEQQVAAEPERLREDAAAPEEVARVAAAISAEVRALSTGLAPAAQPLTPSALARRVLALLRGRFLERAARLEQVPSQTELLPILLAMEQVSERMVPAWDQRFADRLSGPDGLELVVEVAHDLRSPLTSILFLAETLLRGRSGPVTTLQERQLGLIYSAAFGLSSVASDVVELVRGRDRLADLEPMPFSISDIFESVRDIVRPIAEEKGLEVRLGFPSRPYRVGHPVALNRVLLNLVTNALKFTDEGMVELSAGEPNGLGVEFAVRDTGRGIPPQAMTLLFEPFRRRQHDREYAFSGSGLGLSICRKFVEAMGSDLQVETELGKGTRFSFVLQLPGAEHAPSIHSLTHHY